MGKANTWLDIESSLLRTSKCIYCHKIKEFESSNEKERVLSIYPNGYICDSCYFNMPKKIIKD